jgi:hypothetical protein
VVLSALEQGIKSKIERIGTPLKEWDISIYRGVLTGFNEAFIISQEVRDKLISESPKSAEIIRPILRGRDIHKFQAQWNGMYLIATHTGYTGPTGKRIPPVNIDAYPAVRKHLDGYWKEIEARLDQGDTPYHLRSCIYMDDFFRPKIVWGEISDRSKFAYDESDFFVEATSFLMTGEKLKYLLGMLNSKLLEWHFNQIGTATGVGTNRWKKYTIELLPIKKPSTTEQESFEKLIDLVLKSSNDVSADLLNKIDQFVYRLYDLNEEEVAYISNVDISK